MTDSRLTMALVARIPAAGVADFQAYEGAVLQLLGRHGGLLERRLRTADGATEIHVVSFPDAEALAAYRTDPERAEFTPLLTQSGAEMAIYEVTDVE
jgi:hypothetical protein